MMEKLTETYAYQKNDIFVAEILKRKHEGVYVELGSHKPVEGSNTYLLEKNYDWTGLSIDNNSQFVNMFNDVRKNKAILHDAVTFDYLNYFKENNFPKQIDYLSLDIDGNWTFDQTRERNNPLLGLIALPLNHYRFSIIHFEHDIGMNYKNEETRDAQREILSSLGYGLIQTNNTDDWWVDPTVIPWIEAREFCNFIHGHYKPLVSEPKTGAELVDNQPDLFETMINFE